MRGRSYVELDPSEIEQARQMDIMTYMRLFEPENLVHVRGNIYSTREHDSLKISNGKWYWWSRGIGGVTALDYLIKVRNYHFVDAVDMLTGRAKSWEPKAQEPVKKKEKRLLLPPKSRRDNRMIVYLLRRGIDGYILKRCIDEGIIYESADYHNVIFVGTDEKGKPRYAACRGIYSEFKKDAYGSDKEYSFRLIAKEQTDSVHIFESAIDLLSYATWLKLNGRDYERENLLSLSGVYQPKKEMEKSKIPIAVSRFLKENPNIKSVFLHLDNDFAGRTAAKALQILLEKEGYEVLDRPPPAGKDVNDFLLIYLGKVQRQPEKSAEVCR